jgi:hypothetical protein
MQTYRISLADRTGKQYHCSYISENVREKQIQEIMAVSKRSREWLVEKGMELSTLEHENIRQDLDNDMDFIFIKGFLTGMSKAHNDLFNK